MTRMIDTLSMFTVAITSKSDRGRGTRVPQVHICARDLEPVGIRTVARITEGTDQIAISRSGGSRTARVRTAGRNRGIWFGGAWLTAAGFAAGRRAELRFDGPVLRVIPLSSPD